MWYGLPAHEHGASRTSRGLEAQATCYSPVSQVFGDQQLIADVVRQFTPNLISCGALRDRER